jgi:hypothetical protein
MPALPLTGIDVPEVGDRMTVPTGRHAAGRPEGRGPAQPRIGPSPCP